MLHKDTKLQSNLPTDYSVQILRTSEYVDSEFFTEVDRIVLQAWWDHEPVVAEWLSQQSATADIEDAWVWIVRHGNDLVGTARMTIHPTVADLPRAYFFEGLEEHLPGPIASLNRLSVIKPHDGKGIATFLDRARTTQAKKLGAQSVAAICQIRRAHALEKYCGFNTLCEPRSGKAIPEVKWCVSARGLEGKLEYE